MTTPKRPQVSVRGITYARIKEAARKRGMSIVAFVAMITETRKENER